jgi:hypothetical protein
MGRSADDAGVPTFWTVSNEPAVYLFLGERLTFATNWHGMLANKDRDSIMKRIENFIEKEWETHAKMGVDFWSVVGDRWFSGLPWSRRAGRIGGRCSNDNRGRRCRFTGQRQNGSHSGLGRNGTCIVRHNRADARCAKACDACCRGRGVAGVLGRGRSDRHDHWKIDARGHFASVLFSDRYGIVVWGLRVPVRAVISERSEGTRTSSSRQLSQATIFVPIFVVL